jgi:predicted DNA-binding transcriptional regulator AlpA
VNELTVTLPEGLVEAIAQRVTELLREPWLVDEHPVASPWLDVDAACAHLGFSRDRLYKLTAARAIPCRKKRGGQGLRFHGGELDAWMQTEYPRLDRLG